ncbi:hypothetical protein D3C80_1071690 [compost metagenome]
MEKNNREFPFRTSDEKKEIEITKVHRKELGNYPQAMVLVAVGKNHLKDEDVDVDYITNENNQTIKIIVNTQSKEGVIILY